MRGHTLAEITCLGYYAAEAAYRHGESWRLKLISYLQGNRNLITRFCREEIGSIEIPDIEATYLAWMNFQPAGISDPAPFFEKEAQLFLSDGCYFGQAGHARLNFGCSRLYLEEALGVIREALGKRP